MVMVMVVSITSVMPPCQLIRLTRQSMDADRGHCAAARTRLDTSVQVLGTGTMQGQERRAVVPGGAMGYLARGLTSYRRGGPCEVAPPGSLLPGWRSWAQVLVPCATGRIQLSTAVHPPSERVTLVRQQVPLRLPYQGRSGHPAIFLCQQFFFLITRRFPPGNSNENEREANTKTKKTHDDNPSKRKNFSASRL